MTMELRSIENLTGFAHASFTKLGADNQFCDVVVVKVDLRLADGRLRVIPEPAEIVFADHYANPTDPRYSVITRAGDAVVSKPATDVLLTGHALAPEARPCTEWACELGLRTAAGERRKRLLLTGPRHWQWSAVRGFHLSEAEPVVTLPLTYDLAYGGHHPVERRSFKANPAGRGWYQTADLDRDQRYPAPQILELDDPLRAVDEPVAVAGFGPMARWWTSRYQYAGTYDEAYRAAFDASPHSVYPADFDARFFQCAHPDWIIDPYLRGDETFRLAGFGPEALVQAELPGLAIEGACVTRSGKVLVAPLPLDTVHIDLDRRTVSLVWRVTLPQSLGISMLALRGVHVRDLED
ncbi:putative exported protein [Minicystis rosea]|nr:putative exported protein [Minicystis rosea]